MTRCFFMTHSNSLHDNFLELAACGPKSSEFSSPNFDLSRFAVDTTVIRQNTSFGRLRIAARSPTSWWMYARSQRLLEPLLPSVGMPVLLPGEMRNMADRAQYLGVEESCNTCFVEGCQLK